jgi:5-methylcytosine-specific restriction enzyme A
VRAPHPLSPCSVPHCPNVAVSHGRCLSHAQERRRQEDVGRPTSRERGYDSTWAKVRKSYLAEHLLCEYPGCMAWATQVHHIEGVDAGHNEGNLMALCASHHSQLTAKTKGWGKA